MEAVVLELFPMVRDYFPAYVVYGKIQAFIGFGWRISLPCHEAVWLQHGSDFFRSTK